MKQYDDFNQHLADKPEFNHFLTMSCLPVISFILFIGLCAFTAIIFVPTTSVITLLPNARTPLPKITPTSLPTLTPTASPSGAQAVTSSQFSPSNIAPSDGSQSQSSQQAGVITQPGAAQTNGNAYAPSNPDKANNNTVGQYNSTTGTTPAAVSSAPTASPTPFPTPPPVGQPGNEVVINLPATATPRPTATAAPTKTPTLAPTPTPNVDSVLDDESDDDNNGDEEDDIWSFIGVRTNTSLYQNGMLVYGNMVNHSETAQEIEQVSATFYDTQGNVIGEGGNIQAYWPGYTVPPGGASMPFQLLVSGLEGAADFDLNLGAISSDNTPREDFEFSEVSQSYQYDNYCVDGYLRNTGSQVEDYLIVSVVLYDKRDNVINFQDEQIHNPAKVVGDETYHFKICVPPPYGDVDQYDLQAWGY